MDQDRARRPRLVPYIEIPPWKPAGRKRALSSPTKSGDTAEAVKESYCPSQKRRRSEEEDDFVGDSLPENGYFYTVNEDEIEETGDLVVYGETSPEDADDGDIPVRFITDFHLYRLDSMEVVPMSQLEQGDLEMASYGMSGIVQPWEEDSSDDDTLSDIESLHLSSYTDWDRVRLTRIVEYDVHHVDRTGVLDPKLYVRTQYAWYILGEPALTYRPFFAPLWTRHRLTHLFLCAAMEDARLSYSDLQNTLPERDQQTQGITTASDILGREFSAEDLENAEVNSYLVTKVLDLKRRLKITRSALVRALCYSTGELDEGHVAAFDDRSSSEFTARHKPSAGPRRKSKALPEAIVYTTPLVNALSEGLFSVPLQSSKKTVNDTDAAAIKDDTPSHPFNPTHIRWGRAIGVNKYKEAFVDGVRYQIGDVVMVVPDGNYNAPNNVGRTTNYFGDNYWFCRIQYFHDVKSGPGIAKMFHGQWLLHGSRTFIGELSHPGALFVIDSCGDNPINCIFKKCNFKILRPGDDEPQVHSDPNANEFHCGLMYDEERLKYYNLPTSFEILSPGDCYGCSALEMAESMGVPKRIGKMSFSYGGIVYHQNDFVYIIPTGNRTRLLEIAQILAVHDDGLRLSISVQYLERYTKSLRCLEPEDFTRAPASRLFYDERRLVLSNHEGTVYPHSLSGVCFVQLLDDQNRIDDWVKDDDHFYVDPSSLPSSKTLLPCDICLSSHKATLQEIQRFIHSDKKAVAMELFAGAGGLGLGMELSQFVETRYVIEFSDSAAFTYHKNHPKAKVYCQDTNLLLKQAVEEDSGKAYVPLESLCSQLECPKMPSRQENIDFILGGPPCQGFSRANHTRKENDIRTTMPVNMLSYAEHYDPTYFLLENVTGLLDFKLRDHRLGSNGEIIERGMLKFIVRALIALGYQVHWNVLQAAQYGVPQSRNRLIIWAAKRGATLPKFPVPTHAFEGNGHRPKILGSASSLPNVSRALIPDEHGRYHQCAPFLPISIFDAIADLPAFEWSNPYLIQPYPAMQDTTHRLWFGKKIPQLDAVSLTGKEGVDDTPVGYYSTLGSYAIPPMNRYQQWLREGMRTSQTRRVQGQYTRTFQAHLVESTTTVPLKANATHKDLPLSLRPKMALPGEKQENNCFYGRLDGSAHFKCAMTQFSPTMKNSWPLHPLQKRVYSVRELARAQGFPDSYNFYSTSLRAGKIVDDQIKQIGNAVAVPFAKALGKELGIARIADWREKERSTSPVF
ncbi:hypothetical protein CC2G_005536 [Coprinopsis cinerea AmutBmut pab1-1]|nr:hypothetical protein CC2G_005536 [Coprinopsis cinerea AmutBmut pab1-1]